MKFSLNISITIDLDEKLSIEEISNIEKYLDVSLNMIIEPVIPNSKLNNNNADKALETDYYFLKLSNFSNSCYANSTIQALLSMGQPFFDKV
jgi:ubiquitin C-terminal hydrolase